MPSRKANDFFGQMIIGWLVKHFNEGSLWDPGYSFPFKRISPSLRAPDVAHDLNLWSNGNLAFLIEWQDGISITQSD
jgi:hypothetical protein